MVKKRPSCISCNRKLSPWGKTQTGKKRYGCNYCKKTRLYKKSRPIRSFDLFRQYVLWGLTYEMLSSNSGFSVRHLENKFHGFFDLDPPKLPRINQAKYSDYAYLLIDGLWFGRWFVLLVYRQSKNLTILHISVAGREASGRIEKDLKYLKYELKYIFSGAVTDGGTGVVSALKSVLSFPPS